MNFNEDEMTCIKETIADNQELSQEIANCSEDPNPRTCIQDLPELKKCFNPVYKASFIPLPVKWLGRLQIKPQEKVPIPLYMALSGTHLGFKGSVK